MRIKGTVVITLKSGEKALILLTESKAEQFKLYQHLATDAYQFKNELSEEEPEIKYISSGFKTDENEIIWDDNYIAVPNWYDKN
ncbi:hypothetical protein [Pedobacter sp. Leaf132]|uniref:hypothetical protein n=1 Tax=Pedobacter sp. Leaf132 TaxID=2876557 RepID=UPI001E4CDCAB|nr:hypothetical protein [Pedobacter sp. Leaf132]